MFTHLLQDHWDNNGSIFPWREPSACFSPPVISPSLRWFRTHIIGCNLSVCLYRQPNIWTAELSDGWRAGNFSYPSACSYLSLPFPLFSGSLHLPISSQSSFFCFVLSSESSSLIVFLFYLPVAFPASVSSFFFHPPPSPTFPFSFPLAGCSHIYSPVPAREWAMCVSPMVAEGAAEPEVNIRCESSHL